MVRAVLYGRFSSENQREESIMAQFRDGREYCKKKGYTIVKTYADEAKSGTTTVGRDQYNQMLADAADNKFDVVIFHKVDRNARNEYDYYNTKRILKGLGVSYEYSKQEIDGSTSEGQFIESIMVGYAAYYSRNLSSEIKKGLRENAIQGKNTGGKPAYGYDTDKDKKFVINEHEATAVKMVFNMFLEGKTYREILDALTTTGHFNRYGKPFSIASLHDMLTNVKYKGTLILGKSVVRKGKRNNRIMDKNAQIYENVIPVIIPEATFERVQKKLHSRKRRSRVDTSAHIYALSGLVYCAECGKPMAGHSAKNQKGYMQYYYRCKCKAPMIRQDDAEEACLETIKKTFLAKGAKERMKKLIQKELDARDRVDYKAELKHLQGEYSQAMRRLNNLYLLLEDGEADEYDINRLKEQKAVISGLKQSIADVKNHMLVGDPTDDMVDKVLDSMREIVETKKDPHDLRSLFHILIKRVDVSRESVVVYMMVTQGNTTHSTLLITQNIQREIYKAHRSNRGRFTLGSMGVVVRQAPWQSPSTCHKSWNNY